MKRGRAHAVTGSSLKPILLVVALVALPLAAAADPQHPDSACRDADGALDARLPSTWYEFCAGLARGEADARVRPTQVTLSPPDCNPCTYQPSYHVTLTDAPAGEWTLRGTAWLRSVSGGRVGGVVADSTRAMECHASGALAACEGSALGPAITAGNFNTFQWQGEWRLYLVDPAGAEHLMGTGAHQCTIAQYYGGGVC